MSAISLKSITGITSITTPAGVDDQLTLHNNNTTEAVKLDVAGNIHINNQLAVTGVSTFNGTVNTATIVATAIDLNGDIDVDGHTHLDNVSIAGVTTFSGTIEGNGGSMSGIHTVATNPAISGSGAMCIGNAGSYRFIQSHGSQELRINPVGNDVKLPGATYIGSNRVANITNNADNRVITGGSSGVINGESELTYTGGLLKVAATYPSFYLDDTNTTNNRFRIIHNNELTQIDADPNNVYAGSFINISVDGSEKVRIDSGGKLRVASTTESADGAFDDVIVGNHSGNRGISILSGATSQGAIGFAKSGTLADGYIAYNHNSTATSSSMILKSSGRIQFNAGSAEKLRIDSSGHMGLGVTPSAWPTNNDYKGLQVGSGACIFGRGSGDEDRGGIAVNYYGTTSGAKYITNGHAARIYMADGNISLQNAASNSSGAGAAMTLNTRLNIDATDGHIDFTGSTSSTLGYVFQNGTSGASADVRVLIKSYSNSGADPYLKFDAGGQDMVVGTSYQGTTNNLLCLGPGASPSSANDGLTINGIGKAILKAHLTGQEAILDIRNDRTRTSGHMYGIDFRDSSNESNANIVVKQNASGNNAAEMRFYVNPGTGGNGVTNGNLIMTLTQGGDVDIESDLDVGSTLSLANGYVTLQKRDSDDNTRAYIHSRGNAYGGNQALNGDNRSPSPSDFKKGCGMSCFFSSINGNNSGGYIDAMHFSTYSDSSGGSPTMLGMSKSGNNIYYYRHGWLNNGHMATTDYSNASKYSVNMTSVSDARAKEEVVSVASTTALSLVSQLRPVTYKWTDEYINDGGSRNEKENQFTYGTPLTEGGPEPATRVGIATVDKVVNVGFIAQEVEAVIPTVVHQDRVSIGGTSEHWKNIDYDKLVPILTGAIQELKKQNEALEARIKALE